MTTSGSVPEGVEGDFPLARLTTIRTGGPAEFFARVGDEDRLRRLLAWAEEAGLDVGVVGSGSNLLIADSGVRGLMIKLDGELAKIERQEGRLVCGGGARLPQVAATAAALGLGGLEFGVNIPGTVGGAVRMNASAFGGELGSMLEWVDVCDAAGTERRAPEQLGLSYRRSSLGAREVVVRASFVLEQRDAESLKKSLAEMRERRKEAQPLGISTFGSTFKNPEQSSAEGKSAGELLEAVGCKGLEVGAARFSPEHANFIENRDGRATTADVLALMAEGRRRVRERFGLVLEPEVQLLGDAELPDDATQTGEGAP